MDCSTLLLINQSSSLGPILIQIIRLSKGCFKPQIYWVGTLMSTHLNNICLLELCLREPLFGTFSVLDVESASPLRRWIFQNFVIEPRMISSMLVWLIGAKLWNMLCLEVQKIRPILRPSLLVFGAPVRCFVWTTSPTLSGRLISPPLDGHLPQDPVEGLVGNFSSLFF